MAFVRKVRVLALFLVFLFVALNTYVIKLRTTDWDESLWMVIYPVNADGNRAVQRYLDGLNPETFRPIEAFMAREAADYGVSLKRPVTIKLAPQLDERPPAPPRDGNVLKVIWWSLKMRFWAYTNNNYDGPAPDIQMFVVYHDPELHHRVDHSLGLQKGLVGVVNAFASSRMASRNNVVIAHELLHTVGASDKYDPGSSQPRFPEGYAEPERQPLFPQNHAEIMGGRVPLSRHRSRMPEGLSEVRVGADTAAEIRWIDS